MFISKELKKDPFTVFILIALVSSFINASIIFWLLENI